MPLITVIVPVYQVAPYLRRCLDSILDQTFTDYDVILVDDGSTDDGPGICDEYALMDSRFFVLHRSNAGCSDARNAGLEWALHNSDSRYISFVDSDDWIHPRYLELLYRGVQETGCGVCLGHFIKADDKTRIPDIRECWFIIEDASHIYCENSVLFIVAWAKLFRKADFAELRFPVGKLHEDEFLIWKILFRHGKLAVLREPVYAYYQRPDGIMNSRWVPEKLCALDALEEQKAWIAVHGDDALKEKVRYRLVMHCTNQIRGMKTSGVKKSEIRRFRNVLREYIRSAKGAVHPYTQPAPYMEAWPALAVFFRIGNLAYRLLRKCGIAG